MGKKRVSHGVQAVKPGDSQFFLYSLFKYFCNGIPLKKVVSSTAQFVVVFPLDRKHEQRTDHGGGICETRY